MTFVGAIDMTMAASSHPQALRELRNTDFRKARRLVELEKTSKDPSQSVICLQTGMCLSCPPKMVIRFLPAVPQGQTRDTLPCLFAAALYPDLLIQNRDP